jgi:hypothetical protein
MKQRLEELLKKTLKNGQGQKIKVGVRKNGKIS